mmetsp:Transcript_48365/g.125416  ORF Transcript_48365/g.125416 Transcript_48365/m.125416 type:complete len:111 (-) Transcript_48365:933-1265(-)
MGETEKRYRTLKEFYPFYLSQHMNPVCRSLHFIGTTLVLGTVAYSAAVSQPQYLLLTPLFGYSFAWVGHFFFEKNKPATFKYPLFSLASDFVMYFDILRGKQPMCPSKSE